MFACLTLSALIKYCFSLSNLHGDVFFLSLKRARGLRQNSDETELTWCSHLIHFSSNSGEQSPLEGEAQRSREQLSEMTSCRSSERKGLEDEPRDPMLPCRDFYRRCVSWVFSAGIGVITVTFLHNPLLTSVPSPRSIPPSPVTRLLQKPLDWPPVFIQLHDSVFATEQLESSHVLPHLRVLQWLQPTQKKATVLTMAFSLLFPLASPPTAHPFAPSAPAPLTSLLSPQILFTGFPSGLCTCHSL